MRREFCIFCVLAVILALSPRSIGAAPLVQVRDRVDIEMDPVTRSGSLALFRGRLIERAGGKGAARKRIRIQADDKASFTTTDSQGNFRALFSLGEGEHLLSIDFAGDEYLDAAHFEMANFDIAKVPVALTLTIPSAVSDRAPELRGEISANTGEISPALSLRLFYGPASGALHELRTIQLNEQGYASLVLSSEDLGPPGRKRLEIRYAGSEELDSAMASKSLVVSQSSNLTLTTNKKSYDYGDTIIATGRLLDGRGNAIVSALVSLRMSNQSIGQAKSDSRGDFLLRVNTDEIGSGSTALQAQYKDLGPDSSPSLSKPVRITIGQRKPIPIVYTVTAFALASFALLSFVTLRTKPWLNWRRPSDDEQGPGERVGLADSPPPLTGLAQGRRKLRSTIGRASFSDFHGRVRNAMNAVTIADAAIVIASHREQELRTDEDGRFAISELSEGDYKIIVSADGFVSEHFSLRMPHRGEFHDAVVDLLPVREKIFSLYKYAVRKLLPDASLWGIWTPRQILNHVRETQPSHRLSQLTDFVEESFFSQRIPNEDKIDLTRALIRGLDQEE